MFIYFTLHELDASPAQQHLDQIVLRRAGVLVS